MLLERDASLLTRYHPLPHTHLRTVIFVASFEHMLIDLRNITSSQNITLSTRKYLSQKKIKKAIHLEKAIRQERQGTWSTVLKHLVRNSFNWLHSSTESLANAKHTFNRLNKCLLLHTQQSIWISGAWTWHYLSENKEFYSITFQSTVKYDFLNNFI